MSFTSLANASEEEFIKELQKRMGGDNVNGELFNSVVSKIRDNVVLDKAKLLNVLTTLQQHITGRVIAGEEAMEEEDFITRASKSLKPLNIEFENISITSNNYLGIIESTIKTIQSKESLTKKEFKEIFQSQCEKEHKDHQNTPNQTTLTR